MHKRQLSYIADQAKHGSLVIFVGAGVSKGAGLPGWGGLIEPLLKQLKITVEGQSDPLDEAQWYVDAYGRQALLNHVRKELSPFTKPSPMHQALARIQAPVYFTTNYDQLMESALEEAQAVPPDVVVEDGEVALIEESQRTSVVKLHGCLSLPETIVLTRDDYDSYADRHRAMTAYMQSLLATRTFLFVGVSLTDPNFRAIHQIIRRALGEYNRTAYLLDGKKWPAEIVRFWDKRGVKILEFPGKTYEEGIAREIEFLEQIAVLSRRNSSGIEAANNLGAVNPPPIKVQPLVEKIQALPPALEAVFAQVREDGLLKRDRSIASDVPTEEFTSPRSERSRWLKDKARALLDLALAVDALVPIAQDDIWIEIGDTLYDQKDAAGAIRAYSLVLRPGSVGRRLDASILLRVYGNLARAYIREGHFSRAEWLLRRCLFLGSREQPDGEPSADSVFSRLNLDHLRIRPTDASEFAYVVSRKAERLMASGHYGEAFSALREARHALGEVIGETGKEKHKLCYFDLEHERQGQGFDRYQRYGGQIQRRRSNPKAYALNFLGKCYRLSAELTSLLGKSDADYYRKWSERYLCKASACDPYLPYPYGHRFSLAADPSVPATESRQILKSLADDLIGLANDPEGKSVVREFLDHLPHVTGNEPSEVVKFRERLARFGESTPKENLAF